MPDTNKSCQNQPKSPCGVHPANRLHITARAPNQSADLLLMTTRAISHADLRAKSPARYSRIIDRDVFTESFHTRGLYTKQCRGPFGSALWSGKPVSGTCAAVEPSVLGFVQVSPLASSPQLVNEIHAEIRPLGSIEG